MSHFTVLVVGSNVDEQLEPFNEAIRVPKYVDKTKAQLIQRERESLESSKKNLEEYRANPEEYSKGANPEHIKYLTEELPKELLQTDEQLHKKALKWYEKKDITKDGGVYSTYNPNSKWDWYAVGGRWAGFFKLKAGKVGKLGNKSWTNENKEISEDRADQALKGDIDFDGMKLASFEEASSTYDKFEQLWKSDPKKAENSAYFEFGVHNTSGNRIEFIPETREAYIKRCGMPCTFAVLNDGMFYERGSMGWWAIVSDEKDADKWNEEFWKLIESVPDDTLLSVVDCHI